MTWKELSKFCLYTIIGGFLGYLVFYTNVEPSIPFVPNYKEEIVKKDSLVRDSIYKENDSIKTEISNIEKEYDKKVSNILSGSDSINMCLFSEYIEHYNNKRTASDN